MVHLEAIRHNIPKGIEVFIVVVEVQVVVVDTVELALVYGTSICVSIASMVIW